MHAAACPNGFKLKREPRSITWLKSRYLRLLSFTVARRGLLISSVAILCLAAAATLPFFGGGFLPDLHEGHFIAHAVSLPGTSLGETERVGRKLSIELLKNPQVVSVAQQIGRAELADDTSDVNYSEFHVKLKPDAGSDAEEKIRKTLALFPGFSFSIKPFLSERMEEILSGATGQVVVKVFGNDLDLLDRKARDVSAVLSSVKGAADVQISSPPGLPEDCDPIASRAAGGVRISARRRARCDSNRLSGYARVPGFRGEPHRRSGSYPRSRRARRSGRNRLIERCKMAKAFRSSCKSSPMFFSRMEGR